MSEKHSDSMAVFALVTGLCASSAVARFTIPTVTVGNPANAADSTGFGSVAYAYEIGATEVTAGQYTAFLNAVARIDSNTLYNSNMALTDFGSGITRSGVSGSYMYSVSAAFVNRPVNYVTFWDAVRFANWLHNGQPAGAQDGSTTEDGAYTLTPGGIIANTINRNAGWQWAVTSEDEWYKAAFYQPAAQGGDSDNYWLYPTSSNTVTTAQANYSTLAGPVPVGSYAANFYGTFDMGGNLWEWNEAIISGSLRGLRGGSYGDDETELRSTFRYSEDPLFQNVSGVGFRVSRVPGPSSVVLLAIGGLLTIRRRR